MQITHKQKNVVGWALRLVILFACAWFIHAKVDAKWTVSFDQLANNWGVIIIVCVLAVANWGLEVWRWKISLNVLGSYSWFSAMQQVFGGLTLNWIMPFTSGDLVARLLPHANRQEAGVLIFYNRVSMLAITLVFGGYGIYVFSTDLFESRGWILGVGLALVGVGSLLLRYYLRRRDSAVDGWFLLQLIVLSVLRFGVFTFQFYLLISAFNPELAKTLVLAGVGWTFLFRSIIPSIFGHLGVREVSAMLFFETHVSNMLLVLTPSLLIWLINTVAPSVLGLYFLLKYKVKIAA